MSHDHHHHAPQVVVPEIPNKPSWFWRAATGPAGRRNVMLLACSTFSLWLMAKMTIGALDNRTPRNTKLLFPDPNHDLDALADGF
jgi:hypothetical protein